MRGVAEYAMLGRKQAIIIVLLCGFIPLLYFVSAAIVALVNLRKGWREGWVVLLWALLPAILNFLLDGSISLLILMPGVSILALVLRQSASWEAVMLAAVGLGIVAQLSLILQPDLLAFFQQAGPELKVLLFGDDTEFDIDGESLALFLKRSYGPSHMLGAIACLILARWWQAKLYNPGGFRQEFHNLRISPRTMLILLILITAGLYQVPLLEEIRFCLMIPALIQGLAVMHGLVGLCKAGVHWLVLGYFCLYLMPAAIILLGAVDSFFDFRRRVST